jgi:hypothetical protein
MNLGNGDLVDERHGKRYDEKCFGSVSTAVINLFPWTRLTLVTPLVRY